MVSELPPWTARGGGLRGFRRKGMSALEKLRPLAWAPTTGAVVVTAAAMATALVSGVGPTWALSTPTTFVITLGLVTWVLPMGVAFIVQVLLTEVIRLSCILAEEEDEEEDEEDEDDEEDEEDEDEDEEDDEEEEEEGEEEEAGPGQELDWGGMRGRVAVQQWEWQQEKRRQQQQGRRQRRQEGRQQERQPQPPSPRPPSRQRQQQQQQQHNHHDHDHHHQQQRQRQYTRERRVVVEWEAGQLFLVIRRPIASEWLINLVNSYMHGPIPMKVESCRAEMVRVCLSPAQILRQGSMQAIIVGLRTFGRRTHEDEWDEGVYYEKAIRFRRWAADHVQSLIEGTYGRKMKAWGGVVDSLINNVVFETRDLHLRIDDRFNGHCFGLFIDVFDCRPGVKEPESLGATPHEFSVDGMLFYVDPHNEIALSPQCTAMTVEEGKFRVEFPDIFRTLILNREIMPGGRGKRLRVRGDFTGIVANVQANQMRTFLFSLLGTFCPYKYSAWKATIREQAALDCKPVSASHSSRYREAFGTLEEETRLTVAEKKDRQKKLEALERHMSYRDILVLRKEARGWRLEDMGDEPPENPPLDPELMSGIRESDSQYEQLARYAARVQGLLLSAWEKSTCLREIMVETLIVRQMEIRLFAKADIDRDGPEDKAFKSPLQAVMLASKMEGRFRMFIARTKASNRLHSRAANGVDGEPSLPWLMSEVTMQHPVVLDEATATRLGYGSTCILGPTGAVTPQQGSDRAGIRGLARGNSEGSGGESETAIPEVGGTFRMWSDYRMALEGHGSNVQAGTLLAPVLDVARTVADSFRRRWASGGQYPERILARVRLAEKEDGDGDEQSLTPRGNGGETFANGGNGGQRPLDPEMDESVEGAETVALEAAMAEESKRRGSEVMEAVSAMRGQGNARQREENEHEGDAANAEGEEKEREGEEVGENGEGEEEGAGEKSEDSSDEEQQTPHGGLRRVFSHLDGLDSEMLVERALEDLHDEQEHRLRSSLSSGRMDLVGDLADGGLESIGRSGTSVDETALGVASSAALDVSPPDPVSSRSLLATADATAEDSLTMVTVSVDPEDEDGTGAATRLAAGKASPVEGTMQTPTEDVFMLPGWHYLALSGRSLSIDFQWSNLDLVLMQDPTAQQGRDTGKNVLALRSSGALTVSSSGAGESVDIQLERATLLPCFYRYTDEAGGEASGPAAEANGISAAAAVPPIRELERGIDEECDTRDVGPALRLAQLLGGGQSALMAVERTWLGQGLVTADSRPLLDPFTVQIGYGTVVARATGGGRESGTTDGRGVLSGNDSDGGVVRSNTEKGEGRGNTESVHEEENEDEGGLNEDMVAGVFRVAVSEVQLLAASATRKGSTTVEVEVSGQKRSFLAAEVMPSAIGDGIELEFACRCRLRRRRGRRRRAHGNGIAASATSAGDFTPGTQASSSTAVIVDDPEGEGTQTEGDGNEEDEECREAEPEVTAKVRLLAPGGEVVGEAWAELPGAPADWARYPLYSPGVADARNLGSGADASGSARAGSAAPATSKSTGLDRGEVIPAPPATVRRRWGWGMPRRDVTTPASSSTVRPARWFRPRQPRDVAGEVRLRLGWMPSGLAVTVHRCRMGDSVAESVSLGGGTRGVIERPLAGSRRRRSIVVRAEPGGGAVTSCPIEVDAKGGDGMQGDTTTGDAGVNAETSRPAGGLPPRVPGRGRLPSLRRVVRTDPMPSDAEENLENFFVLDPSCLLGGVDMGDAVTGADDVGDEGGGGAQLILSMLDQSSSSDAEFGDEVDEALQEGTKTECAERGGGGGGGVGGTSASCSLARAELLLFPGADPARRWVKLTDPTGNTMGEVDITVAWAVASPRRSLSSDGESDREPITSGIVSGPNREATATAGSPEGVREHVLTDGQAVMSADSSEAAVTLPTKKMHDTGDRTRVEDAGGGLEAGVGEADAEGPGGDQVVPEPVQVVSRCFSVHASNLVLRVSDLDVAVLVTMAKGIVRAFKPPKSKEEKELELEAVQQRLLEEANSKRNAAIQQLRATFQRAPSMDHHSNSISGPAPGAANADSCAYPGLGDSEELLHVRDVVELLRDFLRAKALTESEIRREAEEFMLVVLAVEDEAKRRTPGQGRARSASPTSGRRLSEDLADSGVCGSGDGDGSGSRSASVRSKKRWRTRLRPGWLGKQSEEAMATTSTHDGVEGFICPQCHKKLVSPAALLAHFSVFHGGGVARGGGDDERNAGSGGSSDEGIGASGRGIRRSSRRKRRSSRDSWRGGSISLDHFILALQSFMEEQPHEGYVMARCEEFASDELKRGILAGYPSLPHRLADISPIDPLPEIWGAMKEAGATPLSAGRQQARVLQTRMVRAFKNYGVARSVWAHLVVPSLFAVPRCGSIKASSGHSYLPMPCPVREGQPFYVDKPAVVITHLPAALVEGGGGDEGMGSSATGGVKTGGGAGVLLSGIMTNSKDRGLSGVRAFLTFTLDRPAVVYVCYDKRLTRLPVWLLYFEGTDWIIHTTEGPFGVWRKRYTKGQVRLGCNEGWRKGCAHYFLLVGADSPDTPHLRRSSLDQREIRNFASPGGRGGVGGGASDNSAARRSFSTSTLPLPSRSPVPHGLLPDVDSGNGEREPACPHWTLRPQVVAGGKGSLAQAVRALVDERRKSRAKSRSKLLPGGTSRSQLDAAAATAAELGLELALVEYQYTTAFDLGTVSFRVVDPSAAEEVVRVKAEIHLSHASGSLALRHLHPGDWLGRPDSLTLKISAGGNGTYYNPLVDAQEHFIEPWVGLVDCHSEMGEITTELRVEMPEHLVVNITSALVENIKVVAALVARNWADRYTEPMIGATQSAGGGGTLLIRNALGVDVAIQSLLRARDGDEEKGSSSSGRDGFADDENERDNDSGVGSIGETRPEGTAAFVGGDFSRSMKVAAGQSIECLLPARTEWGDGVAAELVVFVPGFKTLSCVRIGSRGTCAYPLTQLAPQATGGRTSKSSRGVAERVLGARAAPRGKGLALVVDVLEKNAAANTGGSSRTHDDSQDASMAGSGLIAELRTNVCVQNASASDVEVDMAEAAAAAAVVETARATKGVTMGNSREDRAASGADGRETVVVLVPGARVALPLSVLASWRLRIAGDATNAWSRPLRLSPALLDPAVPNALRLTGDMERNSVCLRLTRLNGGSFSRGTSTAPSTGSTAATTAAAASAARGEPFRSGSGSILVPEGGLGDVESARDGSDSQPQSPHRRVASTPPRSVNDAAETTGAESKSVGARSKKSPLSSPLSGTSVSGADWVLVVQPSYLFTNALPCTIEVEVFQPPLAAASAPPAVSAAGAERSNRGRAGGVDDASNAFEADEAEASVGWKDGDNSSDSDVESVASSVTASQGTGARRVAAPTKAASRNPALDLFFLPTSVGTEDAGRLDGVAGGGRGNRSRNGHRGDLGGGGRSIGAEGNGGDRTPDVGRNHRAPWLDSQRDDYDVISGFQSVWRGLVGSGHEAKVGRVDNTRPFYVRVRLPDPADAKQPPTDATPPPCYHWSDFLIISTADHTRRSSFNSRQPEDITWHRAAREDWGRSAAAEVGFGAPDGSQEARGGRSRRQQCPEMKAVRSWARSSARRLTFYAPYWIVNKTGLALNYRASYPQKSTFSIRSSSSDKKNVADGGGDGGGEPRRFNGRNIDDLRSRVSNAGGNVEQSFRGGRDVQQRSAVSSAEESARAQVSRLLLRDATYVGDEENLDFFGGRSLPVMLGCPAQTLEVMPYALAERAEDAGLCVCDLQVESDSSSLYHCATSPAPGSPLYTDCAVRVVAFPEAIAEAASSPRSAVQILTPWREPPAPDKEAFMTFWATRDALVHVCVDSRTPHNKLPSWLEYAGFRKIPNAEVATSEPGLTLEVHRRFFRARTLIKLGGSDNGRDLAQALTDLSGAAVTPDGPAPRGMLANYTVVLTTVSPQRPPAPPIDSPPRPMSPTIPWRSPRSGTRAGLAGAAGAAATTACGEEADVRDALVDRDVTESIVCRRRYRILPDFGPGDRPYVDREYTIPSLPPELQGLRLTCVQTAQGDKRAGGSRLWRLSLMQDSVVLVVFDGRAQSVPLWLAASGFSLWEGVEVAGAQYKIPYVYKVYRKRCATGLVWLGGNGAKGCKWAKRGYFVLVYVARPLAEAARSPRPLPPPLHIGVSSSDPRGGVVDGGDGIRGSGRAWSTHTWARREREISVPSSTLSRSSTVVSDSAATNAGDEVKDDFAASVLPSHVRSLSSLRHSAGSHSFQSLHDLATGSGSDVDVGAVSMTGGEPGESCSEHGFVGLRRRGMSTTDAVTGTSAVDREGAGGRPRAWTGGEEAAAWKGGGGVAFGNGAHGGGGALGVGRSSKQKGSLQRISALWDIEKDGPLSQIPVPFDRVGRRWSRKFNVEAAKTAGPLDTSGATLGVSVSALTGHFHRTRVVTLYPRLIVRNFLGIPVEVMPTVMSPKAGTVARLSKCIPPAAPPRREPPSLRYSDQRRFMSAGIASPAVRGGSGAREMPPPPTSPHAATITDAVDGTEHLAQAVPTSAAVIVYAFNAADQLVKGLAAATGRNRGGTATGVGGDADDHRKCVLLRAAADSGGGDNDGGDDGGDVVGGSGGFGVALAAGLSRPVLAEEMGETHLWVVDSRGRRHLAAAFVSLQRATVFLTLTTAGQFPPFRVENRSSAETLAYRQVDAHKSMGWHILPPLSWHAFLWQEPDKPRAVEVAFETALISSSAGARHSEEYYLDTIGERDPLEEESITRSVITLVATGTRVKRLFSEVRVEGRTRMLSFGDVRLSDSHAQGVNADSVTRMKRLYTQLDLGVRLAGFSFNVVECSVEGPSEVMSAHVDSVTMAKRSGGNAVELQIFHVQVDDMRRRTRMPIVFQPSDSGFNSHLRGGSGGWSGGGDEGAESSSPAAMPVPFVRVLYEREVATLSMPHLKSFDLELQETRANIDVEFVLHLLRLAGSLLPELISEEVLAKMCRKNAKATVRHTVPTPAKRDLSMVYLEAFRHSTIVVRVELLVGQGALSPDAVAFEDPEATTGGLTVLGGGFLTVLSVLGSSIAHVNPTFVFDELVVTHYCGSARGLSGLVVSALTQQAVAQGYKVVGSMELLGDPLSLVGKLGDSVVQFFHKTKAEMTGDAHTMGAGAKVLVKGLVGGTFGSAAKITGSLEAMIRGLSGTAIAEHEAGMGSGDDGERQGEVKDLEHGVKQGGKVFYESMKAGITGLIDLPAEGAKEEGFAGFIAGMAKGIVGAVAAPVAGALGAVARVTEGVDASTRLSDEKRMGRRRAARTPSTSASAGRALAPLTPTDLVKHVPRKFATLWVGTAGGHHGAAGPPSSTPDDMPGAEAEAPLTGGVASSQGGGPSAGVGAGRG